MYRLGKGKVDLRDVVPFPSHVARFAVLTSEYARAMNLHPDKAQLRATILAMNAQGMSYRAIGAALGIHWTRVGQIKNLSLD